MRLGAVWRLEWVAAKLAAYPPPGTWVAGTAGPPTLRRVLWHAWLAGPRRELNAEERAVLAELVDGD